MAEVQAVVFRNPDRIPFAVAMLDCWLGNDDRNTHTESILAETFGHATYGSLVHASRNWSPEATVYGPESRAGQAWLLSSIVGRPEEDCGRFLDLLNAEGRPIDEVGVLGGLSAYFSDSPRHGEIMAFFGSHRFLLNDADLALRLRKAGKRECGIGVAMERRHMDVLDAIHEAASIGKGSFHPGAALAIYYSSSVSETAFCDSLFEIADGLPGLLDLGSDYANMIALLRTAKGYPADPKLDFRVFTDIIREPVFPIPASHDDLRAAVGVHHALRDITDEFFGIAHPNYVLPREEWRGSWKAMEDELRKPECQFEFLDGARMRIRDFVESYIEEEREVWIRFEDWNVLSMARESLLVSRADDAALARYLAVDDGSMWKDEESENGIREAVERFRAGHPKRTRKPVQEENDPDWKDNPLLHEVSRDIINIARGRGSK